MRKLLLTVRLRADQLKALQKIAKDQERSVGWCIRAAIDVWLKKGGVKS